jgi:catechol 2,3-dioxygenase-like lactoylglutathione lyase family enzyme
VAVIRYLVSDVNVGVEFYTNILGFELVEKWGPPFAMVKRGDLILWLRQFRLTSASRWFQTGVGRLE